MRRPKLLATCSKRSSEVVAEVPIGTRIEGFDFDSVSHYQPRLSRREGVRIGDEEVKWWEEMRRSQNVGL